MKIKLFITTILLLCSLTAIQAQSSIFNKLSDRKDVTTVFISKTLLSMMPKDMDMGGADIKSLMGKLEQIEIYTSESDEAAKLMKKEMQILAKSKSFETLMKIKDGTEVVQFYAERDGDKFKDMIMFTDEEDAGTIIRIQGSFTAEDIQTVVNNTQVNSNK